MILIISGIILLNKQKTNLHLNKLPLSKVKIIVENELNAKLKKKNIIIKYNGSDYIINYNNLNVRYDLDNIKDRYAGINTLEMRIKRLLGFHNYELPIVYDTNKLKESLKHIRQKIYIEPKNADISINNDILKIDMETIGRDIDFIRLEELLSNSIKAENNIIYLPLKDIIPKYSKEYFENITGVIGGTNTKLYSKDFNRTQNIKLALSKLNNKILHPNDSLSLNKILGNRIAENGYKVAPVIINSEMDSGIGGGVCQVASTLYKASLLGCLKIDERRNHSIPSQYTQMGQDATLVQDYVDLKITNNKAFPILFEAKLDKNAVVINIYGNIIKKQKVTLESHIDKILQPQPPEIVLDNLMLKGENKVLKSARNGYKVSVYRNVYQDGILIKKEKVSTDYYSPVRSKIVVGVK